MSLPIFGIRRWFSVLEHFNSFVSVFECVCSCMCVYLNVYLRFMFDKILPVKTFDTNSFFNACENSVALTR